MAKGDATTTPPYALGFTVGSTISEDGKFLAYVARSKANSPSATKSVSPGPRLRELLDPDLW